VSQKMDHLYLSITFDSQCSNPYIQLPL